MNKQDKRNVMSSLSQMDLSEEQVLTFIKNLAQSQMFKSPHPYTNFCVDCGIFYTNNLFTMSRLLGKAMDEDEYLSWSESFIEKCEELIVRT